MQTKSRKLLAVCMVAVLMVTYMATGLSALALGTTNLLANLTLSNTSGITVDAANNGIAVTGGTETYFNNLTLEKNSTYEYSFNLTINDLANTVTTLALRGGDGSGQYISFWSSIDQVRVANNSGGDPFVGIYNPFGLVAGQSYAFRIVMEPTRVFIYVDGALKALAAGADSEGAVPLNAVKDGKIGIITGGAAPNVTLSNLSLIKTVQGSNVSVADVITAIDAIGTVTAYSRESIDNARAMFNELDDSSKAAVTNADVLFAAEAAFAAKNLLADFDEVTLSAPDAFYFEGVTLDENATYVYEFDITYNNWGAGGTFPWFALRENTAAAKNQYINAGAYGCIRPCDTLNFDAFLGNAAMSGNATVSFKILMEPARIKVFMDGNVVAFGDNVTGAPYAENWVPMTAVADAVIGFTGGNPGASYTISNASLTNATADKVDAVIAAIAAIGTVTADSRSAIVAARAAFDALVANEQAMVTNAADLIAAEAAFAEMNLLADVDASIDLTGGTTMYFGDVALEKDATYVYEFDITFGAAYNATFPWMILRDGGQYINLGAYGCIRVCDNLNFDDFEGNAAMTATAGVPLSFKIIMEPDRVKVFIDGEQVAFGANIGAVVEDGFVSVGAVEKGKIGVTGGNPGFPYTMSNLSLIKVEVEEGCAHEYFYACDTHCMNCGELTNPEAAHTITHVDAVEATCQAMGNVEYWTCSDCNVCWRDEALMMQTNFRSIVTFVDHNYVDGICSMCGQADPDAYTIVSTEQYNGRLTFEVREKADGSHTLVVSGTGVMPTNKQVAGYEFLNYSATTTKVIIEEGVTTVGYGIFNGWTALASVELPFSLTTIDGESFRGCTGLKAIEIPYGVTTLGYGAFWGAGLESVVIPESVTSIKNYVFYRCKSLVSAEIYGTTDYKVGSRIYKAPGARMFSECSKLSNIVLGENINLLNTYCFHGTAITEFTVPARVKFVYDAAFHSCTKMTKFVMEEGVTYLGWAALFGCSSLTDVTIPETITGGNIATWAFGACTSLESIELPSKLTNLKKRTFSGCTSLKSIELPETVTTLGDRVFIGCTALESVKLSNITKIDVQTFNNCPKLTSITIPETVTSIGDLAFRLNSSLKTVYIDSATIAAGLTGNAVYGNMIKWAETIAIRSDITNVPSYVTSNYKTVGSVTVDGVEYTTYSK